MSTAKKLKQGETITRALRVEIVKPLNHGGWDEVGARLRALRTITHRVMQGVFVACCAAQLAKRDKPDAPHIRTVAYQAAARELSELQEWAKTKKGDNAVACILSEIEVSSALQLGLASAGYAGFAKWAKDRQRNKMPEWRHGAPIEIAGAGVALTLDGKGIVLSLALDPGKSERYDFAVKCGKGVHYGRVLELARGEKKPGAAKVVYDERQKKWFAFLSYTEERPTPPSSCDQRRVLVVHRGRRNALTLMPDDGPPRMISGAKIMATKKRLAARRQEMQRISRCERGSGVHGHGRKRRYEAPDALAEKEARAVRTWCQQMGSEVARTCLRLGIGRICIEDYGGIQPDGDTRYLGQFPFYQLKQSIEWAAAKAGLDVFDVPSEYISSTCPACGNADTAQHNTRTGVFHCAREACGFERQADWIAAFNMLKRAGASQKREKALRAEKRIAKAVKS